MNTPSDDRTVRRCEGVSPVAYYSSAFRICLITSITNPDGET